MDYKKLVEYFNQTQAVFQAKAVVSINQSLVLRNWLFGFYIVEYEQNGKDYAKHGERLLYKLADELKRQGIKGVSYTNLTLFRKFYLTYPQFSLLIKDMPELDTPNANLQALPEDFKTELLALHELLSSLSFTHFVELLKIDNPQQRLFYEIECIKGGWSYRIDLKMDEFTHEDAGQMNFYLNYFRSHEMQDTDNPPVGIILCSLKNEAVVKYATGGLDNRLFVSRYLLRLPSEEQLKQFLIEEKKKLK